MTYVDTTLTPAATYTYVHNGQIYDQIATTLGAHSNWQYVEYVDATNSGTTYRRHVWRCKSAGTGLPSDFYVMFQTQFVTATGVYSTITPVQMTLAEGYSSGTLSKFATTEASITPASDLTNPATWALSTYTVPASNFGLSGNRWVSIGPQSNLTSVRLLYIVAKDVLITNWGVITQGASNSAYPCYVGMYDTLLGANDPMPLIISNYIGQLSGTPPGGATRAPLQTPGVAVTEVFTSTHRWTPGTGSQSIGNSNPKTSGGILGLPSDTTWAKSDGGVVVTRCYLSSFTTNSATNSTKGFVRGYLKYVRSVTAVATHSMGDTFLIDGKAYLGLGDRTYGLWDTTAT